MTLDRSSPPPLPQPKINWDRPDPLDPDTTMAEKLLEWKNRLKLTSCVCNQVFIACPGPTLERHLPGVLRQLDIAPESQIMNIDARDLPPGDIDLKNTLLARQDELLAAPGPCVVLRVDHLADRLGEQLAAGTDVHHLRTRFCHDWCQNTVERPASSPDDPFFALMEKLEGQGKKILVVNHLSSSAGEAAYQASISSAMLGHFSLGKFASAVLGIPA